MIRIIQWVALACGMLIAVSVRAGPEVGDYSVLPEDLAAAAVAYDLAQFKSNRSELERLLADDYMLADTNGRNLAKADSLAQAEAPAGTDKSVVISQQVKRSWPNGAVLGGMVDASEVFDGKRVSFKARIVDVWAKHSKECRGSFVRCPLSLAGFSFAPAQRVVTLHAICG